MSNALNPAFPRAMSWLWLAACFLLLSGNALACKCAFPNGAKIAMQRSDVVLTARAISTKSRTNPEQLTEQTVRWKVLEAFKGRYKTGQSFISLTGTSCCACGIDVKKQQTYLLYLSGKAPFAIISCSGSTLLSEPEAQKQRAELRKLQKRAR